MQIKIAHLEELYERAQKGLGVLSNIVKSVHDGAAMKLADLEAKIQEAGFIIEYTGRWCRVWRPFTEDEAKSCHPDATAEDTRELIAQGMAPEKGASLFYAVLGRVREEEAAHAVDTALTKAGVQVDSALRQTLCDRFIQRGGHVRLTEDMKSFQK